MHEYINDSKKNYMVYLFISILSIMLAKLVNVYCIPLINIKFGINLWWIDVPSILGFYCILFGLFDRLLWKLKYINYILKIIDLSGEWKVKLRSSYDGFEQERVGEVSIKQTWSKISIKFNNDTSSSHSINASLRMNSKAGKLLSYEYISKPKASTIDTMNMHYGYVHLEILDNNNLKGDYFSDSGRKNHGTFELCKVSITE